MEMEREGRVAGKVAIITGAASGIGKATAIRLAREGAVVSVVDMDDNGGRATVKTIKEAGGEALFIRADVGKSTPARRMIERTEKKFGRLDIIHNNAIWNKPLSATELDEKIWDRILDVGLKAAFLSAKYGIPVMRRTGGGCIINTGSVHSLVAFPYNTAYTSAKAGILGITRSLARDYGPDIRVNAVLPGAISTPIWDDVPKKMIQYFIDSVPAQRLGTTEEIANAVLFLASDEASFITGTSLAVDGGLLCRGG
ncbi:SDR family NAD(P)-dependent oxidoreductase [Thermodesulfobacteriota bacterium]